MNKRTGIIILFAGILVAAGVILMLAAYHVTLDPTPPDVTGRDNGQP